eukprot:m.1489858 g.1489858  ORF g.1489858 m.1489858 type:complete len:65 (+) comp25190_c0_seq32:2610-2804(+)
MGTDEIYRMSDALARDALLPQQLQRIIDYTKRFLHSNVRFFHVRFEQTSHVHDCFVLQCKVLLP